MNFELTDDHLSVQKLTREFAAKTIAPGLRERDRENRFDRNILTKMAESDILGICLPEKYGGAGMDYISLGLACEELEYIDTSARVILSVHIGLNSMTLLSWGNQLQKEKYLIPQAKGEKIASFGLTEPNAGSDAGGTEIAAHHALHARRQRDLRVDVSLVHAIGDRAVVVERRENLLDRVQHVIEPVNV